MFYTFPSVSGKCIRRLNSWRGDCQVSQAGFFWKRHWDSLHCKVFVRNTCTNACMWLITATFFIMAKKVETNPSVHQLTNGWINGTSTQQHTVWQWKGVGLWPNNTLFDDGKEWAPDPTAHSLTMERSRLLTQQHTVWRSGSLTHATMGINTENHVLNEINQIQRTKWFNVSEVSRIGNSLEMRSIFVLA